MILLFIFVSKRLPGSWNLVNLMFMVHQVTHLIQQKYFIYKKKKKRRRKAGVRHFYWRLLQVIV